MPFLDREQRVILVRAALAGTILFGMPYVAARDSNVRVERQSVVDLGLKVDEAGFWQAVQSARFGILTETWDKEKLDCPTGAPGICMGEASPSFRMGINASMLDFMLKQSRLYNPSLPTNITFVEEWLSKPGEKEHASAFTVITKDQKEQIIVVSLKAAAFLVFKDLERRNLSLDYFNGAISFFVSSNTAHEFGHGGAQTKLLGRLGNLFPEESFLDKMHPQIYDFQNRYTNLYDKALEKGMGDQALIFVVNPINELSLVGYRSRLYIEAQELGLGEFKID